MTGFVTPHATVFTPPQQRQPAPDQTLPEVWADPKFADDPAGLLCELIDTLGEDRALALWMWATLRLRMEKQRLWRRHCPDCYGYGRIYDHSSLDPQDWWDRTCTRCRETGAIDITEEAA